MATINQSRLTVLPPLTRGSHTSPDEGLCFMEAVAWVRDMRHTDAPPCVSRVIRRFGIRLNDRLDDEERQALVPLIPVVVGTATTRADEITRAYLAADFAARITAPAWFRVAGLTEQAATLEAMPAIVDRATARDARRALDRARAAAYAAADAAAAAYAAADAAAAAAYAAADADADAAADAAAAAYAAADADARATRVRRELIPACVALIERMAAVGR